MTAIAPPLKLTPRELARCVQLFGCGYTLPEALARIQAERPSLPFPVEHHEKRTPA